MLYIVSCSIRKKARSLPQGVYSLKLARGYGDTVVRSHCGGGVLVMRCKQRTSPDKAFGLIPHVLYIGCALVCVTRLERG